ncbi:MAG: DNA-protecting protein DprA, partial [Candidatus Puniceispirillaceae bacterium]
MKDTELLDRLRLIRTSHIGPITCQHLLKRYGTVRDALSAIPELSARGGRKLK